MFFSKSDAPVLVHEQMFVCGCEGINVMHHVDEMALEMSDEINKRELKKVTFLELGRCIGFLILLTSFFLMKFSLVFKIG